MITVSLETAKKLKEAGFTQTTCASWVGVDKFEGGFDKYIHQADLEEKRDWSIEESGFSKENTEIFAAPTFEEIWNELPITLNVRWEYVKMLDFGFIGYLNFNTSTFCGDLRFDANENIAEAAAELWLELKSEGHI